MRILLLALISLSLLACKMEPDTVRIGSNHWLGHAPLYLADELQWTESAGLRLVEHPNASGMLRGFRNDLLDSALLPLDEALTLQSSGLDLDISLITDLSAGANALYAHPPLLQPDEPNVIDLPIHAQVAAQGKKRVDAEQRKLLKWLWYEALHLWQAPPDCAGVELQQRLGLAARTMQDTLARLVPGDPALNRQMLEDGRLLPSIERLSRYMVEHHLPPRPARPRELLTSCGDHGC
ncbi:type 2 periplasmic-binding domain-containing protein [Azotobacter armeniacus]